MPNPTLSRCLKLLTVLFFLSVLPQISFASSLPQADIIIAPGFSYSVYRNVDSPAAAEFRSRAAVGLMSVGMPRKADPFGDLFASLNAGDTANVKNPNRDLLARVVRFSSRPDAVRIIGASSPEEAFRLASSLSSAPGRWVILCGFSKYARRENRWENLGVAAVSGPRVAGGTLTSPTTHTPGLVALRDIAPTALDAAGFAVPPGMTGSKMIALDRNPSAILPEMDRITNLNGKIQVGAMWAYGLAGGICLLLTALAISRRASFAAEKRYRAFLRSFARTMLAAPLAFLVAPVFSPASAAGYGCEILVCALAFGFFLEMGSLCAAMSIVILIDGLTGSHLASRCVLSEYWISGIRFYGIGAEYMGALIGAALLAPYFVLKRIEGNAARNCGEMRGETPLSFSRPPEWFSILLAFWQIGVLFILAFPAFGAKAGGSITAACGFIPSWLWLTRRKKPTFLIFALSALVGFALIFALGALAGESGARPTHIQKALGNISSGQWGVIGHIVLRKIKMAVSIAIAPGSLTALAGLVLAGFIGMRTNFRKRVESHLAKNPLFFGLCQCALCALAASLLFNDSGFVSFVLIAAFFAGTLMEEMLGDGAE